MGPTPIAHRVGTVLLAVLLVGSLVAPAAMAPVAADDDLGDEFEGTCDSPARFVLPISCGHADPRTVDDSLGDDRIEADIWLNARQTGESWESSEVLLNNYMEDTSAIASLEARDAIATSWEDGDTVSEADIEAKQSINDYYSRLQIQITEEAAAHQAEIAYQQNQSHELEGVEDDIIHHHIHSPNNDFSGTDAYYNGNEFEASYELRNGTVHNYTMQEMDVKISRDDFGSDWGTMQPEFGEDWENSHWPDEGYSATVVWDGQIMALNQPEYDLDSREMYDLSDPDDKLDELDEQAQMAVNNYEEEFVEELYTALDEGEITPEDVRGAEGTVRYMSGDSEVTDERFRIALSSVLGLEHAEFNSTMVVSYDGYTDIEYEWNESGETREANYSGHVSETYEGLLFAGDVPEDGFETNETYHTDDLNGTVMMATANESVYFERGEFVIDEMVDADGEPVTNVTWERPDYETYNASEYVELLEEIQELHDELEDRDDGSGSDVTLPGIGDVEDAIGEYSGVLVGVVIIVAVVFLVVGFVTDILPWT
ncbi:hypothetical protein AB7C87_23530 [Natrarchaeobius sp. A-rgal3]|uniref:hypothetical protein n=1 Tax=Natrarchaeobius versutus TaxID=1679078 RepID=UPI00350EB2E8